MAIYTALVVIPADSWANFILIPSSGYKVTVRDIVKVIRSNELALKTFRLFFPNHTMHQHQVWEELRAFQTLFVAVITTNPLEQLTLTKVTMRT